MTRACGWAWRTLYAWIYAPQRRDRQLWQYLPRGHKKRRRRSGRKVHSERIKWRTSIHDRPGEVEDRIEFGHWESDSVLGVHSTGALHTTVERRSRFLHAAKLPGPTARATLDAQIGFYQALPAHAVASVTADNGSEFAYHYQLADRNLRQRHSAGHLLHKTQDIELLLGADK